MKKIIVKGKPDLRMYEIQCSHCGCLFRYTKNEIYENKNLIGHPLSVACPWCLTEIKCSSVDSDSKETFQKAISALEKYDAASK